MPSSLIRCWETTDPLYLAYHDEEWGRPVTTERGLYELVPPLPVLEVSNAGPPPFRG